MASIYTLTLSPSLDSATMTPQIYPEGKLRCSAPVFEPGGGGINVARAITHLGGKATAIFPAGGATGEHLVALLADEQVAVDTVDAKDWTRQNLHVHVESSGEQYRFVMPGAKLSDDEFRQLEEKVLTIESGALLVISGSLPPGVKTEKLTALVQAALQRGIRCIVDSSGEALKAALEPGQLELVKPNQKELSALVNRELSQPDDVRTAAEELVRTGKSASRCGLSRSSGCAGRRQDGLCTGCATADESQSTVGAGDSMVGAMVLKLAQGASLLEMARYGVAAGSAATINQGTRLCSLADTQKIVDYLARS